MKARIGLKVCSASFISSFVFIVTILGIVWVWDTRFLKPSRIMMSVLSSVFLVMSFRVSLVVFCFLIVVSSFVATAIMVCAPAWACFHVSRPLVSIVNWGWWMCFAVATLYPFFVSPLTMVSTVVVLPECRLPTTAIIVVGKLVGIFPRLWSVWVFMVDCGSWVKFFLVC